MADSSEKSTLGTIVDFIRGIASALVGIPTALAASVLVGTMFLMVEGMNICYSHVRKTVTGEKKTTFEPLLNDMSEFLKGAFVGVWTEWGIYGFRKAGEYAVKVTNALQAHEGYQRHFDEPNSIYHNSKEADPSKALELAQKEISSFFKDTNINDPNNPYLLMNQALTTAAQQTGGLNATQNAVNNLTYQGLVPTPSPTSPTLPPPTVSPSLPPASGPAAPPPVNPLQGRNKKKRTPG